MVEHAQPNIRPKARGRLVRWAGIASVGATAILAVVLASRFGTDPQLVTSPLIGQPAPDATLHRLNGEGRLTLTDLRGHVVVVNFWASWCVACRAEHDDLLATADAFHDRGVRFVGVVYQDDPVQAAQFLDELGWGDDYEYVTDPGSRAAIGFGVFGVPETFFIDASGIIVGKITGESDALLLGNTLDHILEGARPGEHTAGTVQSGPGE
ncbi:MAG: TlpA family protein disulfide reductase [Acidimicrobiia bacterium]